MEHLTYQMGHNPGTCQCEWCESRGAYSFSSLSNSMQFISTRYIGESLDTLLRQMTKWNVLLREQNDFWSNEIVCATQHRQKSMHFSSVNTRFYFFTCPTQIPFGSNVWKAIGNNVPRIKTTSRPSFPHFCHTLCFSVLLLPDALSPLQKPVLTAIMHGLEKMKSVPSHVPPSHMLTQLISALAFSPCNRWGVATKGSLIGKARDPSSVSLSLPQHMSPTVSTWSYILQIVLTY